LLAVVEEGVEGGFEYGPQSPPCEQLLEEVGDEHEQDVSLGGHRIVAVHVFQSEATVLEHVKAFVLAAPAQPCGSGTGLDVVPVDRAAAQVGEKVQEMPEPVLSVWKMALSFMPSYSRSLIQRSCRVPWLLGK
jgi:hypothetical protein